MLKWKILILGLLVPHFAFASIANGTDQIISLGSGNAIPQVAVDPFGNAIAVWGVPLLNRLLFSRYTPPAVGFITGTWTTPAQIVPNATILLGGTIPQVGIDATGNATAVWFNVNANRFNDNQIFASRLPAGSLTWSTPVRISTSAVNQPVLDVSLNGFAAAIWPSAGAGGANQLQTTSFNPTTGLWSVPLILTNNGAFPYVSLSDVAAFGIITWQDLTIGSIVTRRFILP